MKIKKIIFTKSVRKKVEKQSLGKQFQKCLTYLLTGYEKNIDFKLRQPKEKCVYYFRINKQFRALAVLENEVLKIFDIDNHQN